MTCMNFYPRSATVIVDPMSSLLKCCAMFSHHVEEQNIRAQLDQTYRRAHWKNICEGAMFADLSPEFIEHLKEASSSSGSHPGRALFSKDARGQFLSSSNRFVKVSENYPAENCPGYLSRAITSEMACWWRRATAACTALDTSSSFESQRRFP